MVNLVYVGLALVIPLYFFRYIKSEILVFYNKHDNGVFWVRVNSANRERLNQITKFITGKIKP